MNNTIKKNAAIIGCIGAILIASIYTYQYINKDYLTYKLNAFLIIIPIVAGILSQVIGKVKSGGVINFKSAVGAYVLCIVIIFITEALCAYTIYNHLDPSAKDVLLKAWGHIGENSNDKLAKVKVFDTPTFEGMEYVRGVFSKTLIFTVLGLISGLIISKINPPKS